MFIPDKSERTIRLSVVLNGNQFSLASAGPIPKIKAGARAELIVRTGDLLDEFECQALVNERTISFLDKSTRLWARVK